MNPYLAIIVLAVACTNCAKADDNPVPATKGADPSQATPPSATNAAPKQGIAVHCNQIQELGYCTETPYSSPTWEVHGDEGLKERCGTGSYGKADCPREGRVGACINEAGNGEVVHFYGTGNKPRTFDEASAYCADMFAGKLVEAQ